MSLTHTRRRLSGRLLGAGLVAAIVTSSVVAVVRSVNATEARHDASVSIANDAWLKSLNGKHRQLFDSPDPNGGIPLVHVMNYYNTYNKAYGVRDADINGVLTFYGATTLYSVNDAMWSKYKLGEFLKTNDAKTSTPAVANPWRAAPVALGMTLPAASVEALQKRGATFIVCNNALTLFAGFVAQARGLDKDAVYNDLKANIIPGVVLVPGMVVAIEQAQKHGITYHRQ